MRLLETARVWSGRLPGPTAARALAGGLVLAAFGGTVGRQYLGLGLETIEASVRGVSNPPLAFSGKIMFTSISLAAGGSGGIVTPSVFAR